MAMSEAPPDMGDVFEELETLETLVDSEPARRQVREAMRVAMGASRGAGTFGRVIRGFDRADLAEALVGSILFGIPMAVEGGTQDVGVFLAGRPALLAGTAGSALALVVGILYVADIQDVRVTNPLFGLVPRRPVGVIGTALLAAVVLLTVWGRVDWAAPGVATATVVVAFVPMSLGAALGDILPGS
ncbi:MAG: DUF2391 domain-containing protein [Halobacteriales archaeon]